MGDLLGTGAAIIERATARVELAAQNISNAATAGYKRKVGFATALAASGARSPNDSSVDLTQGKLIQTGNPLDLAILGNGFFVVSSGNALFYTRAGQFQRDGDGRLVTAQGLALQAKGGGDLVLGTDKAWKVLEDGTVVEDGQSTARLAVVTLEDPKAIAYADNGALSAPSSSVASLDAPVIRQGAYEASNVSGASEMVAIMLALRQAETGQKLVSVYDDLMGRVIENLSTAGGG